MGADESRNTGGRSRVYAPPPARTIAREMLAAPGRGLPSAVREDMESRFGRPLDRVRIHEGADADRWTSAGDATALTVGRHIAFSRGSFSPGSSAGRALIAHELSHAVQQGMPSVGEWRWGGRNTSGEREAEAAAASVLAGRAVAAPSTTSAGEIQRQAAPKLPPPEPEEVPWWQQPAANDNVATDTAVEGAGEGAAEEGIGEEIVGLGGAALAGLAAGITVFFWDEDEAGPEWGPEGPPKPQPRVNPRPRPDPKEDTKGCISEWVAPLGDNACHDQCAYQISGVPLEFQLTTPEGETASFDAIDWGQTLHEVKTGYRFMLNENPDPDLAMQQERTRDDWQKQSQHQLTVALRCGYPLVWSFNEAAVAAYAQGIIEPPAEAFDCPCPKKKKPKRRKRKKTSSKQQQKKKKKR